MKIISQLEFAPILYDSLFGLILFFSLDSFLDIHNPLHFTLYLFSTFIVIHWWLLFSAAADLFQETRRTALFIFFNIFYIILLEFMILHAKNFDYQMSTVFLLLVFLVDLIWVFLVKYVHHWQTVDKEKIKEIAKELKNITISDLVIFFLLLALLVAYPFISSFLFVISFVAIYVFFVVLTFVLKVIDLKFF